MTDKPDTVVVTQGRSLSLWAGVIGAPAIWAIQLQIGYALSPWVCKHGRHYLFFILTGVCVLLAFAGTLVSWRDYKAAGGGSSDETDGGPIARMRFLGALGMLTSLISAMTIFAQGIASLFFNPCWA